MDLTLGHIPRDTVNQDAIGIAVLIVLLALGIVVMVVIVMVTLVIVKLYQRFHRRDNEKEMRLLQEASVSEPAETSARDSNDFQESRGDGRDGSAQ